MSSVQTEPVLRENADGTVDFIDGDETSTGQEGQNDGAAAAGAATHANDDGDASLRNADDDEGGDADPGAAGITPEERAKRERRRVERQQKKARARERETNFRQELEARDRIIDDMRQQLDAVHRRSTGADLAALDARIRREEENITYLKNVITDGTNSQNGAAVAEATVQMSQRMADLQQLNRVKQQMTRQANAPAQPQLDPRMVVNATAWMKNNAWYNPASGDADSRQVLVLDQKLAEDGYNPNSPEYWDELTRRIEQTLPHRANRAATRQTADPVDNPGYNPGTSQRRPARSTVAGSGSDGSSPVNNGRSAGAYTLSAERVQALKDAGMWDNPKARTDAIRRFKEFDAQNAAR